MGWFENLLTQQWIPAVPDVQAKLEKGALVADVGCGRGRALIKMAQAFPKSRYVGYDVFGPSVEKATANAKAAGVSDRVSFHQLDASVGCPSRTTSSRHLMSFTTPSIDAACCVLFERRCVPTGLRVPGYQLLGQARGKRRAARCHVSWLQCALLHDHLTWPTEASAWGPLASMSRKCGNCARPSASVPSGACRWRIHSIAWTRSGHERRLEQPGT